MPCPGMWHWRMLPSTRNYVQRHRIHILIILVITTLCVVYLFVLSGSLHTSQHGDDHSIQYGVVIDLGSSGSRVIVYIWPPHTGQRNTLLDIKQMQGADSEPVMLKIEPGISSFATRPSLAAEHVRPLLEYAGNHIPGWRHHETPLYIMATAGVRMLKQSEQDAILNVLQKDVASKFNFLFADSHAEMISGKEEAVYTWIAINYALNNFAHDDDLNSTHQQKTSVGIIDMGGASLQIAYEVSPSSQQVSSSDVRQFNLGCSVTDTQHTYRVFVSTFLGFGGNSARWEHDEMLATDMGQSQFVQDPCRPLDMFDKGESNATRYTQFVGTGDFDTCHSQLLQFLHPTAISCAQPFCSLDGTVLPVVRYSSSYFYGLSELFYSTDDILGLAGQYDYRQYIGAAKDFCATPWRILKKNFKRGLYPNAAWHRLKYQCFKSAWVAALLHEGVGLPKTQTKLMNTQLVNGALVQWTLGAILYKTRYFPLREIEKNYHMNWQHSTSINSPHYKAYIIIIVITALCLFTVIIRCCRHLDSRRRPIHRVPTMSYFMTDSGQREDGIRIADTSPLPFYS